MTSPPTRADVADLRLQRADDFDAVLAVTTAAFGDEGAALAVLVTDLQRCDAFAGQSWLAWEGADAVGHVMLTRGWIDAVESLVECPVLSPLSVLPERQGQGIGSALVRAALAAAEVSGAPGAILEGDPAFYGRLGFETAEGRGILRPSSAIPEAAFQWAGFAAHRPWMRGRFVYPDAFWRHDAVGLRGWRKERATGVQISTVTIGARDPGALARFYAELLGTEPPADPDDDWIPLRETGGWSLAIQAEPAQQPPVWPAGAGDQHMQLHLEIKADDLEAAVAHALRCGAGLASHQPQASVRVMLDPEGHPFCLWVE